MIAPLRETDTHTTRARRRLRRAHEFVASQLFADPSPAEMAPRIPGWKAWLFVVWLVTTTAFYFAFLLGVL